MKEVSITDIKEIKVGHAQDVEGGTGCTVILCEEGANAGVDVRGGGPASRETELLEARQLGGADPCRHVVGRKRLWIGCGFRRHAVP